MVKYFLLIISSVWLIAPCSRAQEDSIRTYRLTEVEVRSALPQSSFRSTAPQQSLSARQIEQISALQVADAMKYFSGVQVKDYGGTGGLKTVSIRSLGANYTAVAYDGISVSDYQTGQIDLGRFSLDNVSHIGLTTGSSDDIFQPARSMALGGLVQIVSQSFVPTDTRRSEIKAGLRTGSWKLINPFASYSRALGSALVWNVSGECLSSKGDYPFRMDGEQRRRTHSEVENRKWESNLTGTLRNGGQFRAKAGYYASDRNIPGAVISGTTYSGESTKEQTGFAQATYRQRLGSRWSLLSNLKYGFAAMQYQHALYPERASRYDQREVYANATLLYQYSPGWSFSWANDGSFGSFRAIHKDKTLFPARTMALSALSGKYERSRLTINLSGLLQTVNESSSSNRSLSHRWHFSPSAALSVQPVKQWPLRLRASYRNTYRLPTFSDIYYPSLPNTALKPENAHQYNLGGVLVTAFNETLAYLSFSANAYYNKVENKIMAIPLSSLALWSIQNAGKADIKGFDLNAAVHLRWASGFSSEISGNYTRQKVLNEKKQLLRYTPRQLASALAALKTPWCELNYTLVYCGNRYYNETPSRNSLVKHYTDQGVSLTKNIHYKACRLHVSAECLNFTNRQYEIVSGYPMQGRSFRLGIKCTY